MKISEWGMRAEAVTGNDEGQRAVADTGNLKGGLLWKIIVAYPDQCRASSKFIIMMNKT